MSDLPEKIPLFILNSNVSPALFITHYTKWVADLPSFPSFEWDFFIIDSPKGEDLILGYDLLYHFNPIIDWKNGLITYDSTNKHSSGINSSARNALATDVNSVALVGELKTPSLPSFVHIPSIMPSKSFLKSRDEVFKEINNVGEDFAISSLHLFQEDMDLPPWRSIGVIYSLSTEESETLQAYISENVEKGFIWPSSSSTGAPVLFVKKKDGGLCLCVDYCKLNAVTRKNRYPVPPMNQLLTIFNSSTIFSKIDLRGAYNLLRIKEVDEHLTAFTTKYGSYEYLVLPFGLINAPFADFLDIFVVVYLDDIMVFSSSEEEHFKHVASVLQRVRDNNSFAKASKTSKIFNLSLALPISIIDSLNITALTSLLKKDSPFIFNEEALSQFQILKEAFTTAPILPHFHPSLPTIVETDSSDYALGALLSQVNDSGKHSFAFHSCKLLPAELHYEIDDKDLLGKVWALKR
ncbi:hypothetical protein O181_082954 [Austropuccinia psidii MF-1]|uniref:Reverse transcriptase domain-containing protein n=1 Tax=Austropuccinia psidii MF-1 TaxID=1389203 RepID=A0A9Q3FQA5_9BASI|nr:hypothetical protein [Austropuccinia psidii MF-1]